MLLIATGTLILVEWNRNDAERIKTCIPVTNDRNRDNNLARNMLTFLTHAVADTAASKLDQVGYTHFLYTKETYVMAIVKGVLAIIGGVLFILDAALTNKLQEIFKATKTPQARDQHELTGEEVSQHNITES